MVPQILIHLSTFMWFIIKYALFEVKYYFLGTKAVVEDITYRKKNRCEPYLREGDVAVVTGGARGIGLNLVKKLMKCKMNVIVGCRNVETGNRVIEEMIERDGLNLGSCTVFELDLEDMDSIRAFSHKVAEEVDYVNVLVNNAGIMFVPEGKTVNGFEKHFGVNYIGAFYLSHLLLPLMKKAPTERNARIVNVTSCAHEAADKINIRDLRLGDKIYIPSSAYARSKLALLSMSIYIDNLLREAGYNVYVYSVHPGIVDTDLFNNTTLKKICPWITKIFKTVDEGATSVLYACISPKLEQKGGLYLSNCKVKKPSDFALDPASQKRLYDYTCAVVDIHDFFRTY